MLRRLHLRWWPRSLVGRVFALYSVTLAGFVALSLLAFYRYQLSGELEEAQLRADALTAVILPAVTDSAVIGDYDTIRRTLERALFHSSFSGASFIDLQGGVVRVPRDEAAEVVPPRWLRDTVAARLYDSNLPVSVGGRDYGVLRLSFAPEHIAGELWKQTRIALLLGLLSTVGGVLLIRVLLTRWLGELGRVQAYYDAAMRAGPGQPGVAGDATQTPLEFRETFEVLDRAAASLRTQRAQAEVTLGAIADGVFTLDERGRVLYANPAACALAGHPLEALLGMPVRPLLAPLFDVEGQASWPSDPAAALRPWTARRSVLPATGGAGGGARVIDSSLSPLLAPDGRSAGHVLACHDVTRQHQLDQRLRQELQSRESALAELRQVLERQATDLPSAAASTAAGDDLAAISRMVSELARRLQLRGEQLDAIFALSAEGFASFDARGRVNYVSPSFVTLSGLDAAQLIGADEARVAALLGDAAAGEAPWRGWAQLREAATAAVTGATGAAPGTPRRVLLELRRPARRTLALALRRSGAGGGGVISQVLSVRDVTHETLVEQMKSEFLSTAAHELRTPMASIYGFTELLLHRPMKEERRADILATIHRQSQRMIAILNELLDLARIEARRGQDFVFEPVELGGLLAEACHDFQPPAAREAPDWQAPAAPAWVRVDRNKLQQALLNVLSNAYKYSPGGGEVTLRLVDGGTLAQPRVGIEVVDRGIGLSPEQLARVGERFYRVDDSGTIAGTGLGMSIVREILELLGGRLELASRVGEGTRVTLWLPRVAAPGGGAETAPSQLL